MASLKSQNYGINIAKSIEGGSMKLTTLVHYMYMCAVTNAYLCNECSLLYYYYYYFESFFLDLLKAKPLRYCTELLV